MLKRLLVVLVAVGLVAGLAACGSSDDDSTDTGSGETTAAESADTGESSSGDFVEMMGDSKYSTPTLETAAEAEEKGVAYAKETNPKAAKLPQQKVGILLIAGTVESVRRSEYEFVTAAEALGWTTNSCDAQGLPTGFTNCMSTLINEGAKAIATIGVEPSLIAAQLKQAKERDIPVVAYAGKVELGDFAGAYYPDDAAVGKVAADYFLEQVEARGGSEVTARTFPAGFTEERQKQLDAALASKPDIKLVQKTVVDAADPVGSAAKQTETAITQYPDLTGIFETFDTAIAGDAQAIATKLPGKSGDEIPLLVGFNANLGTQVYMRKGIIGAVGDVNYVASGWVAADQMAEFFARGTPLAKEPQPKYPITFDAPHLVTAEDLPEGETYYPNESNYQAFFKAKWKAEFGVE